MGNCVKKDKENFNEHSKIQRRLRIGIGIKKGEDGEFHFGLEGGYEKRKDKDLSRMKEIEEKKEITKFFRIENQFEKEI